MHSGTTNSRTHTSEARHKSAVTVHLPTQSEVSIENKEEAKPGNRYSLQEDSFLVDENQNQRPQTPNKNLETFYNFIKNFDSERSESLRRSLGFQALPKEIQQLDIKND